MLSGGYTNFKKAMVLEEIPTPWEYLDYFMEYKHVYYNYIVLQIRARNFNWLTIAS